MKRGEDRIPVPDVYVTVGQVTVRHWHPRFEQTAVDDGRTLPEAVGAICSLTFHFGDRVRSKWLRAKVQFTDQCGWPRDETASPAQVEEARAAVVAALMDQMRAHGFEPPNLEVTA